MVGLFSFSLEHSCWGLVGPLSKVFVADGVRPANLEDLSQTGVNDHINHATEY